MEKQEHFLFMAYYLLGQVVNVKVAKHKIVLLTLGKTHYTPEKVVQLRPTERGLVLYFNAAFNIKLNLNNGLYHELLDEDLMADFNHSRLEFLEEVLHAGLEDGYVLHGGANV